MERVSPSSSWAARQEASTFDELSMQQSLLFLDSLKDLKNLRSQLYSAADYFELSYSTDEQKHIVVTTLKDYAVRALVNTVDHLGSVSFKVNSLLEEKVDEVLGAELRVSCIEQRIRTCQEYINREGLSQQSLVITAPKYYKRYILPGGKCMPDSGKFAMVNNQEFNTAKDYGESQEFQAAVRSTMMDRSNSSRKMGSFSPNPPQRARSMSPSRPRKVVVADRRAVSPLPTNNPLGRSGSLSIRSNVQSSSSLGRSTSILGRNLSSLKRSSSIRGEQYPSHPLRSESVRLHPERDDNKETEHTPTKRKNFLKSLLSRRKSKKDDMLYTYLDEY